jgi:hypothetical protein
MNNHHQRAEAGKEDGIRVDRVRDGTQAIHEEEAEAEVDGEVLESAGDQVVGIVEEACLRSGDGKAEAEDADRSDLA